MTDLKSELKDKILLLILISILIKVSYFLIACLFDKFKILPLNLSFNIESFLSVFHKNDAGWYQNIADNGYPIIKKEELNGYINGNLQQSSWAFFPLFPKLVNYISLLFNINFYKAAFLLIFIASTLSFILFYQSAFLYLKNKKQAWYCTLLFIVFPFNYYYSMFYTESLFISFMLGSILAVYYRKYYLLIFLLPALTLTRPNGFVVCFFIFLFFISRYIKSNSVSFLSLFMDKKFLLNALVFFTVPLTFAIYGLYQYKMTGDFFAFSTAQNGWNKKDMFPLFALFRKGDLQNQFNSIYVCIVLLLTLLNYKKINIYYHVLIFTTILIPLSKGSVSSIPRYLSILLPFYFIAAQYLQKFRFKNSILVFLYFLQLANLYFWLGKSPFSY